MNPAGIAGVDRSAASLPQDGCNDRAGGGATPRTAIGKFNCTGVLGKGVGWAICPSDAGRDRKSPTMGWIQKLLRREPSHEEWLAAHPGKTAVKSPPPAISAEEEARTRATMERELDEQRAKRGEG